MCFVMLKTSQFSLKGDLFRGKTLVFLNEKKTIVKIFSKI